MSLRIRAIILQAVAFASLAMAGSALAVPITFRVIAPASTPAGAPLHVAGNFQGWNPGSAAHRLTDRGGRLYELTLDLAPGTALEFKFTRGDWSKVEKGPGGQEIANRKWTVGEPATLQRTVTRWADLAPGATRTGNVATLTVPGFLAGRRVWVYLPPGYQAETTRRYPVLYMLDGQNVFDLNTGFAGEWMVDETCEALVPAGLMAPVIVVAIDNGGASRTQEYTPWYDPGYGSGGGGDEHLQAIADILVPWVNANYRTLTGPVHTALAGSSLGGLMSLYAAYERPDLFGRVAGLSPSLWWYGYSLLFHMAALPKPEVVVYSDMGTLESGTTQDSDGNGVDDSIDAFRFMRIAMLGQGFTIGTDLLLVEDVGGYHNEWCWAQRFPEALAFLYPPAVTSAPDRPHRAPVRPLLRPAVPNPFNPRTVLAFELPEPGPTRMIVYDAAGRRVRTLVTGTLPAGPQEAAWDGRDDAGRPAPAGTYLVELRSGSEQAARTITLVK